jgi:hypothetical protein
MTATFSNYTYLSATRICGGGFVVEGQRDHLPTSVAPFTGAWVEIIETIVRYHKALASIAESHPAVIDGKEWRMERQDAIQRAKQALE